MASEKKPRSGSAALAELNAMVLGDSTGQQSSGGAGDASTPTPTRSPVQRPAPTHMMAASVTVQNLRAELGEKDAQLVAANEELARLRLLAKGEQVAGAVATVALDQCDDGVSHASALDPERVEGLVKNLAHNPQTDPAVLRRLPNGRYEILIGRHRKAALLALGRTEWKAIFVEMDDDTAEKVSFYSNLLAPQLGAYQVYEGLLRRKNSKKFTNAELSNESGKSESEVSRLMCFEKLPASSHLILKRHPKAVGATAAEELSQLVPKYGERVTEAIQLIVDGQLQQTKASSWISQVDVQKQERRTRTKPLQIRSGRKVFAEILARDEKLTITFANASSIPGVEEKIRAVLEAAAATAETDDSGVSKP